MLNRSIIFLLMLILSGCGKEVNISTTQLESYSKLNGPATLKEGILIKGTPDKISYNGSILNVSKYSSLLALEFIRTIPMNQEINVSFEGKVHDSELVISQIQNR